MTESVEKGRIDVPQHGAAESSLYYVLDSILNLDGQPVSDDQKEWLETEKDRLQQKLAEGNGHPRTSEICLYQILGYNQRSEGPCSGCVRHWDNQFCDNYERQVLIEGVHS